MNEFPKEDDIIKMFNSTQCKTRIIPGTFVKFITEGQFERRMGKLEKDLDDLFEDIEDVEEDVEELRLRLIGYETERAINSLLSIYNQSIEMEFPIVRGYIVEMCKTILMAHECDEKVIFGHKG